MEDKNCKMLFEYLRSILYDPHAEQLDINELDEPFRKLGMGLQYLDRAVREMQACSAALSKGNLSEFTPSRDNFLCENLKNIHANLNHLTWQAKQVAKGDYSQNVSYLGEFSEAFNTMTEQLREREQFLKEEALREKRHADVVKNYNVILLELINRSKADIFVTKIDDSSVLYSSSNNIPEHQINELYEIFMHKLEEYRAAGVAAGIDPGLSDAERYKKYVKDDESSVIWEAETSEGRFYRITTVVMEWQGDPAYAHIITDVTAEKHEQDKLKLEAYFDRLTKIGNRYYFHNRTDELLKSGSQLVFCYCDLDHLKYVNDTFGHNEGDWYLCNFVENVKKYIRENDIFVRMGGDEFAIVLKNCSEELAHKKMDNIRKAFSDDNSKPYPKSFSFGIVTLPEAHGIISTDELIKQADEIMYQHKKARGDAR